MIKNSFILTTLTAVESTKEIPVLLPRRIVYKKMVMGNNAF